MEVAVQGDLDQAFALRGDERKGALCGQGPTLAVDDPERNRGEACLCVVASQDLEDARLDLLMAGLGGVVEAKGEPDHIRPPSGYRPG